MPQKISFFIDGFNLYHSIRDALSHRIKHGKWLDLKRFCMNYLHLFGNDTTLQDIFYFSAFAYHANDPEAHKRHDLLIQALQSTEVKPVMGKFKRKSQR